jgi:predicted membrane protein
MFKLSKINARILIGVLLIILGGLFLLDNYGVIYFEIPNFIFKWQSILIIIGFIAFISSGNKIPGLVIIGIGLIGLFPEFWSLLLIGLGLYIIYKTKYQKKPAFKGLPSGGESSDNDQILNDISIFGGGNKIFESDNFNGGKITAIFGGSEIDLRDCKLAEGENVIDIVAMFGGATLYAPSNWEVKIELVPIFGGFSDQRRKEPLADTDSKGVLIIKGFIIFGGGEIKN